MQCFTISSVCIVRGAARLSAGQVLLKAELGKDFKSNARYTPPAHAKKRGPGLETLNPRRSAKVVDHRQGPATFAVLAPIFWRLEWEVARPAGLRLEPVL